RLVGSAVRARAVGRGSPARRPPVLWSWPAGRAGIGRRPTRPHGAASRPPGAGPGPATGPGDARHAAAAHSGPRATREVSAMTGRDWDVTASDEERRSRDWDALG